MKNIEKYIIGILVFVAVGAIGAAVYFGISADKDDSKNKDNIQELSYNAYNIGEKVTVKLNSSTEGTFYVLKQSSENEEFVTLFAEKNIGAGAFNSDFSDGNEYKGSLIEKKLNELTSAWSNVAEKRLITVDEIVATGLTEIKIEDRCIEGECPEEYTYIKEDSFLLYPGKDFDIYHLYEFYWTMTKVEDSDATSDTNHYIFFVDMLGSIGPHIVGYEPGGQFNEDGLFFSNFGIRPVIKISKKYIK